MFISFSVFVVSVFSTFDFCPKALKKQISLIFAASFTSSVMFYLASSVVKSGTKITFIPSKTSFVPSFLKFRVPFFVA